MIVNDIEVGVQDVDGNNFTEVDHYLRINPDPDMSGDQANRCSITVTPDAAFQVKVRLPPTFDFGKYGCASIRCDVDGATVNCHRGNHIDEGADPLEWVASSGYVPMGEVGVGATMDFAFGRRMNVSQDHDEAPEHFEEKGIIEVTVVCGPMREVFEFEYRAADMLNHMPDFGYRLTNLPEPLEQNGTLEDGMGSVKTPGASSSESEDSS